MAGVVVPVFSIILIARIFARDTSARDGIHKHKEECSRGKSIGDFHHNTVSFTFKAAVTPHRITLTDIQWITKLSMHSSLFLVCFSFG